ncbi:MAG TPA: UvrD-helicase domain-containing protein [Candidatus Dormibacteraeota bacterium]|nr:UvrD-helicase domain-containing protein [Candidatus Dormibacteraeota bacterium]
MSNRPPVADQAERDRLVEELRTTLFVEAGAGTGKTTAVVSRIVAMVASGGLRMERLVAITFTIAAAAELRVRVREGLETEARAAGDAEVRTRLLTAAAEVDRARIETIHAFCSALLRMHPLEAGLPPDVDILADLAGSLDVRERFRRWFDELTPGAPGAEAVRRGLLLGLRPDRLLELFTTLNQNWDLVAGAEWPVDPVHTLTRSPALGEDVERCIALLPHNTAPDELYQRVDGMRVVATRLRDAGGEDEALAALLALDRSPSTNVGSQGNWGIVDGENVCKTIKTVMKGARDETAALVRSARAVALAGIAEALRDLVVTYADERRQRGLVSYQDLLVRARDLVRDHADVRAALHARWDMVAVDEFQDTDPLQAELALRLCAAVADRDLPWTELRPAAGRLCVVGDPKQSIYRFRRADIALYAAVESALVEADPRARVRLAVNFRSGRRIIEAVNAVFGGDGGLMTGEPGVQAEYVPLVAHAPDIEGAVAVFGGAVDGTAATMWRAEAKETAALVGRMLAEGWSVGEGTDGGARPCTPEDVCILMPSRTNLRNLERALERERIRYRLESGSLIVATQEVRDLLNILRSVDDPTDEVALVAALRTPAFGCSDVELVRWRAEGGRWSYQRPGAATEPRVAAALSELDELHRGRHRMSVPRLIEEVLSSRLLRAAAYDDWRPRETRRRHRFVAEQARALARSGRPSLHDAVEYLERLARDPAYDSVAGEDAGEEPCVRVMTIHAAKGLEFPITVLTGLGRKPANRRPTLVVDRVARAVELQLGADFATPGWERLDNREKAMETAERVRLLYVAMTRARDHLVVGLFRAKGGERTDAALLDGLLRGRDGVAELDLGTDRPPPPRAQMELAYAEGESVDVHRTGEEAWMLRRAGILAALGELRTRTATGVAHADAEAGMPPELADDVAASRRGRAATSLGRAVHAVLQTVDLAAPVDLDALARVQAAAEGIPASAPEVARLARAACASDAVRRAAAARHWREVPLGAPVEGVLLEGFVDLLYELPDGRLVVVDYKTDAVRGAAIDARMERYLLQGGVYALLVAEAARREVARIEFVFAAAGETRTVTDVAGAVAEVRAALRS